MRGGGAVPPPSTPALRDFDERLAAVLAAEHAHERRRCVLEPVGDVLAPGELPLRHPGSESHRRLVVAVRIVGDEKALHPRSKDDQQAGSEGRLGTLEVVLGDLPADDDPRADAQPAMYGRRQLAPDVVEVDVNAVRTGGLQRGSQLVVLVVDRDVVAVELAVGALVRAAGDPDRAAPHQLCDLPDDLADRAGRTRDDDRIPRLRPPDVQEAEVRRHPGHADDVERERRWIEDLRDKTNGTASRDRVLLPAELADDEVTGREAPVLALDHLPERLRRDDVTKLERSGVGAGLAHV